MSASSSDNAWVRGSYSRGDVGYSVVARWDGDRWSAVPDAPRNATALEALSSTEVWALSSYVDREEHAHRWDGETWTAFRVPGEPGAGADDYTSFQDASALSADDIWAVGRHSASLERGWPEVVHWNGNRWRWVPAPKYGRESIFMSVAPVSADDVWAVGYSGGTYDAHKAIAAHWNGRAWEKVTLPKLPADSNLMSVVALGPDAVWAVGKAGDKPLALSYDGSEWRRVPGTPTRDGRLVAIAPDGSGGLWAAGNHAATAADNWWPRPYFLHWDGQRWERTRAPGGAGGMYDLTLVPGSEALWAVGTQSGESEDVPENGLIDRYGQLP